MPLANHKSRRLSFRTALMRSSNSETLQGAVSLRYKVTVKTKDCSWEDTVDANDPTSAYWRVLDRRGIGRERRNVIPPDAILSMSVEKLDPPKTYTITLTEEERAHFRAVWCHGESYGPFNNSIYDKVTEARPDNC